MSEGTNNQCDEKPALRYQRVLLKLSGEALATEAGGGISPKMLDRLARETAEVARLGVQIGIVLGGGNLFRGATLSEAGLGRVIGDQMGMLATIMNALAMRDALERQQLPTRVMSAIEVAGIADQYDIRRAKNHLSQGEIVIIAGGTGNPFFTTDSAASLRGIEIDADVILKATKVDGVYSADPKRDPTATRYDRLSYDEVIAANLQVMDLTAICLCRDQNMPLQVFDIFASGMLRKVVTGEAQGTLITAG